MGTCLCSMGTSKSGYGYNKNEIFLSNGYVILLFSFVKRKLPGCGHGVKLGVNRITYETMALAKPLFGIVR